MPDHPPTDPAGPTDGSDPLDELRSRIQATVEAARTLHAEAEDARAQEAASGTAPNGWATPEDRHQRADDVHALARLIAVLRELLPEELQGQLRDLIRQLLLLARAIIEWCIDRLGLVREDEMLDPDDSPMA